MLWANGLVWTDMQGGLVCLITNDAEGDKLEMMRDRYESMLPELIGRAATYGMGLFADAMKSSSGGSAGVHGPGTVGAGGTLAIVGGKMVDVATGEVTDDAVILISNGKIVRTGAKAAVAVPAGAKVINAQGKTILPGLWDMHAHFEQAEWGP